MKRNIVTQRLATVMAVPLAVGLLATDAQARGGGGFGGGHGGGFGGGFGGGGVHGGMVTGRSAFVPGGAHIDSFGGGFDGYHRHAYGYGGYLSCSPYGSYTLAEQQQNGCY
jgi:hypothetical protein